METATTLCSVALAENGKVLASREVNEGYTHAENLHVFIDSLLKEAGVVPKDLSAVAVGSGPGSYTGLRIGVSAAKGLAYGLGIPLIAVNTLQTMALAAKGQSEDDVLYCPMLDARRMEVYCALYDKNLSEVKATSAEIISGDNLEQFRTDKPLVFFGDGMPKCREVLAGVAHSRFIDNIVPSAGTLAVLSHQRFLAGQFEDVAYFEPFYLKDFLIKTKGGI